MKRTKDKYFIAAVAVCSLFVITAVTILSVFFIQRPARPDTNSDPRQEDTLPEDAEGPALPEDSDHVTVTLAGDILIPKQVFSQAAIGHRAYDFAPFFSEAGGVLCGDLNIVAFKCPIDARGDNSGIDTSPTFNAPIESLDVLSDLGADICITAGGHAFDKGTNGMKATLGNIRSRSMIPVGTYASKEESDKPCIIHRGGFDIGVLAYCVNSRSADISSRGEYMINWISGDPDCADEIISDISAIREAGAQFVIVSIEWGAEYNPNPSGRQRELARLLCEGGADVIMGTYPKCVQPVERISVTRPDGSERECLIAYSVGSFFCYTSKHAKKAGGAVFGFDIKRDGSGDAVLGDVFCIPLYLHSSGKTGSAAFRLLPAGKFANAQTRPEIFTDDESWQKCKDTWSRTCSALGDDIRIFESAEDISER